MNADQNPLDTTIREAVEEHGRTLDASVPDFGALIAVRHRRKSRSLAAATVAVALLGIGGVVVATNRADTRTDARTDAVIADDRSTGITTETVGSLPPPSTPGTTTILPLPLPTSLDDEADTVEFFCTNPLGDDQLGRSLFGSCEPSQGRAESDYACTGRIGTDDTGRERFSLCEAVGQLGPIPGRDGDAPFDNPDDVPVRATAYDVQPGDYGFKIAEEFCVSIADLEAANGWTDSGREFPIPGTEILIPNGFDESTCQVGSYTIVPDDTTRIDVADRFCISVEALDTANVETAGYSAFFPGLTIVIPPSFDEAC